MHTHPPTRPHARRLAATTLALCLGLSLTIVGVPPTARATDPPQATGTGRATPNTADAPAVEGDAISFVDVRPATAFHTEISWLAARGISTGWSTPAGREFRPVQPVARDAMAAFLYRLAGSPSFAPPRTSPFSDVASTNPFYKEVAWLHHSGLSQGWQVGGDKVEFRPLAPINRDAMAAFLYRMAKRPAFTPPRTSPFTDVRPSTQFYKEITWLAANGISTGWSSSRGATFRPLSFVNRDAMAAFLFRSSASATRTIQPSGGRIDLPGVASVTFPDGTFTKPTAVRVAVRRSAEMDALMAGDASGMFGATTPLGHQVEIVTGEAQPAKPVRLSLVSPVGFRSGLRTDSEVRIFGRAISWSPLDEAATVEPLPDRFSRTAESATATLPVAYFSKDGRADGRSTALVTLATTPTEPLATAMTADDGQAGPPLTSGPDAARSATEVSTSAAASRCEGLPLGDPLKPMRPINSGYGMRLHPIFKEMRMHTGIDFAAPQGTPVLAVSDGVIDFTGTRGRYGKTVELRHNQVNTDPNAVRSGSTRYAHLYDFAVKPDQFVRKGDVIGYVGSTGGSTGPHLHLEYAPNGSFTDRATRIDPRPCLERNATGQITVRDDGSLADDAFLIKLYGITVCQTSIGASNSCAIGKLRPGRYVLSLEVTTAPDGVGTWEVILADGLTFDGGGVRKSGTTPPGGVVSWWIIVPDK